VFTSPDLAWNRVIEDVACGHVPEQNQSRMDRIWGSLLLLPPKFSLKDWRGADDSDDARGIDGKIGIILVGNQLALVLSDDSGGTALIS
jgi:hypothetical protein